MFSRSMNTLHGKLNPVMPIVGSERLSRTPCVVELLYKARHHGDLVNES